MKGIVLAGGSGTRLYPLTKVISKQLLPIWDKPMVYYPLSVLMDAGIRDILLISTPQDVPRFKELLGDGHQFGIRLQYCVQPSPDGLAQAFLLGEEFIGTDSVAMVLGDNIFVGSGMKIKLRDAAIRAENGIGATVFGYQVPDPGRFGVMGFSEDGHVTSIEEKPESPKSNWCVTGLYFYDRNVVEYVKTLKFSPRGELEITDLNRVYLEKGNLCCELLEKDYHWLDTGTHDSLAEATEFIRCCEKRTGDKIACLEEIAYRNDWISYEDLQSVGQTMKNSSYGEYLNGIAPKCMQTERK